MAWGWHKALATWQASSGPGMIPQELRNDRLRELHNPASKKREHCCATAAGHATALLSTNNRPVLVRGLVVELLLHRHP